jgi:hypothetical protein
VLHGGLIDFVIDFIAWVRQKALAGMAPGRLLPVWLHLRPEIILKETKVD